MRVMSILVIVIGWVLLAEDPLRAEPPATPTQEKGLVVAFRPFSDARVIQTLNRSDPSLTELLDTGFSVVHIEASDIVAVMRGAWLRTAHEAVQGCAVVQGDFTGHLDKASRALDFLHGIEASAHLRDAYQALHCTHEPVSPREFARYLVFRGLRDSLDGLSPESSFLQALSVDAEYPFPARYARAMRDAFARARTRVLTEQRVTVTLEPDSLGLITLIDGDRPLGSTLKLLPGPHLIQRQNASGEFLATALIPLARPATSEPTLWPPKDLRPKPVEDVVNTLEQAAAGERPEPSFREALRRLPALSGYEWIVFHVPVVRTGAPMGLLIDTRGLTALALAPPPRSAVNERNWARTAASGILILVSAGLYAGGVMDAYSGQGHVSQSFGLQGGGMAGASVGAVVGGYSLWQLLFPPRERDRKARPNPSPTGP